jgi:hypothetical protein
MNWILMASMTILTPAFCLLLGFFVTAIRPRDPLAWLLLAAGHVASGGDPVQFLFAGSWSIWILLFGIYFPERLAWTGAGPGSSG